jgi:hypothetical protein
VELNETIDEVKYLHKVWGSHGSAAIYFISYGIWWFFVRRVVPDVMKYRSPFKTLGTTRPNDKRHIPQDSNLYTNKYKCIPVSKHDTVKACGGRGCKLVHGFGCDSRCCCPFQPAVCKRIPWYIWVALRVMITQTYQSQTWRLQTLLAACVCRNTDKSTDVQRTVTVYCPSCKYNVPIISWSNPLTFITRIQFQCIYLLSHL